MPTRLRWPLALAAACTFAALPAPAQDLTAPTSASPASLAYVQGAVDLIHEGLTERADAPTLLLDGDIIRTGNGRAEIVFGDGSLLHLDHDTTLELLSPQRLRLTTGRVRMRVSAAADHYAIDTAAGSVRLDTRGEYGVIADARLGTLDLTVARGVAQIADRGSRVVVRAGERLSILGPGSRGLIESFNSARWDSFDLWSNDRAGGVAAAASAHRLPAELRPYGPTLDHYGRWDYIAPHGYVWFPSVSAVWRPYYDGSWRYTRYGWTWSGRDPFAWPTHHYGRWGFTGSVWFWIPARTWGPAWVSWGFAPGFVSWCPLGWDGSPVGGYWGRPGDHPAYWPNYQPWRAWTIVPRDHFAPRRPVRTHAIDGDRLDPATRRALVYQNVGPPQPVGNAVPRGSFSVAAGSAGAGTGALPRSTYDSRRRIDTSTDDRRGSVRRPDADVPLPDRPDRDDGAVDRAPRAGSAGLGAPLRLPDSAIYRRRGAPDAPVYQPPAPYRVQPAPSRRADDPPPTYRAPSSDDRGGAGRRRPPSEAPSAGGSESASPRGGVRPPRGSESARPRGGDAGAAAGTAGARAGVPDPARSGAAAGAGSSSDRGGAARRRPGG